MEDQLQLDLDSLLQSHRLSSSSSDDDDDATLPGLPHRTVDEILLNHSSSSSPSPSPPSSPSTSYHRYDTVSSSSSPKTLHTPYKLSSSSSLPQPLLEHSSFNHYTNNNNKNSINSSQLSSYSLFGGGGLRSNAKPGAALAAAAAASRSIPTPHAAAIKSRRANSMVMLKDEDHSGEEKQPSFPSVSSFSSSTDSNNAGLPGSSVALPKLVSKEDEDSFRLQFADQSEIIDTNSKEFSSSGDRSPVEVERATFVVESELDQLITTNDDHDVSGQIVLSVEPYLDQSSMEVEPSKLDLSESPQVDTILDESKDRENNDEINERTEKEISSTPVSDEIFDNGVTEEDQEEILVSQSKDEDEVSLGEDESHSQNDEAELFENLTLHWENEKEGENTNKKSPLELAEELEKKQAFTGLHWEEGVAAQPMKLEGVRRGSTVLGYFDTDSHNIITQTLSSQAFRRDHGAPQVLAVHANYIAIGMSRGVIMLVPSKYTPHQADQMDTKIVMLGLQGDRSYVPITSMCFNQQGDLLFAGYGDGHYTVWDVQRASSLKVIYEHKAPVVHMLYLGQETRQFYVISGDTKGVVKLIRFSVVPIINRISYTKTVKLLDETTSTVVCASPLFSGATSTTPSQGSGVGPTGGIGSMMGGDSWKLFEGSSLVEEGVVIFVTHQSALVAKVNPAIEVYAQIPKPDGVREGAMPYAAWKYMVEPEVISTGVTPEQSEKVSLLAIAWDRKVQVAKLVKSKLEVQWKWSLDDSAVGVAWLNDQMLVVPTSSGQLCLYSKDGNLIHQTSFDIDGSKGDDLISYHTYFSNNPDHPEKAHHNCVTVRGATIYILSPSRFVISRLLPWKERIDVLRRAGDWIGALNMGMTLYDGQAHGVIDLPRDLEDVQKTIMPSLVDLLFSYVDEVFSYIIVACGESNNRSDSEFSEAKEQYSRVGGVAVEFCLHIKRADILFDDIYTKFSAIGHQETFLEILEPYILKDMLGSLPPGIMQALVEHYSQKGWLQRVEQCVLHMDILSLDFNQVVLLCREHRLHGALIYLFSKGLDDFRTPLEELLVILRNSERENTLALGYRILIYLKHCFKGLAFPPGHGNIPPTRLPSLRKDLVQFLLENSSVSDKAFTNLHHLLELDTEATLDVLKFAFIEDGEDHELVQKLVDVLSVILDTSYFQTGDSHSNTCVETWPSKKDVDCIFEFIAYYVACEKAKVSKDILSQIVEYLTCEVDLKRKEKQLLAILEVVPEIDWDAPYLLHLCAKAQFHQACGLIHDIGHNYSAALDCYMKAEDESIHAFSFIHYILQKTSDQDSHNFRSEVISRIPDLIKLNREGAFILVLYHFATQTQQIMSDLRAHPESLFLYLKTVMEVHSKGNLVLSRLKKHDILDIPREKRANRVEDYLNTLLDIPNLLRNDAIHVNDEMTELYLELLCRYERESVLNFLETFESYRVDHCLRLCQEFGVVDAAAFLLERVGDVGNALLLLLSDLNDKFLILSKIFESDESSLLDLKNFDSVLKKKEVNEILDSVRACIGLCQRNSSRLDPHESEFLWFRLLDSFCEPLVEGTDGSSSSKSEFLEVSKRKQEDEEVKKITWKVPKFHKSAQILRKLLSMFIKEIVEGMMGYVRLPAIMAKLLSDNGTQEFGDFKFTILGMLGTYDFERRILDTAKTLIEDDTYYTMSLLKKGASHAYSPRSLLCCLCDFPLTKNSCGTGIQVYSCGHATHLHCEVESSVKELSGCPICTPKKKTQRSKGKKPGFTGLVNSIKPQQIHNNTLALHSHDNEFSDNSYNLYNSNQISRFELLNNLQKDQRSIQIENVPQLKLAPPSLYHEKVKNMIRGESSTKIEKPIMRDVKVKKSPLRFPLRSNIFGKDKKIIKQ